MRCIYAKSLIIFFFLLLAINSHSQVHDEGHQESAAVSSTSIPVCHPIFYSSQQVDVTKTLQNCSNSMIDPLLPSSYLNSQSNITVYSQIVLNNLILVDEIAGIAEMDFIYRVSWIDPRWDIPDMWQYLKPAMAREGITITDLLRSNLIQMWLADNTFYDEIDSTVLVEAIRIKPGGSLYWTRHFVMKIAQPGFDYKHYPLDSQDIVIRISPYSYSTAFVRMEWTQPPVLYVSAKPGATPNLMLNQIWSHRYGDYKTEVSVVNTPTTVNGIIIPRSFHFSFLNITITRKDKGIVLRLISPIVALMILSSVTFWATLANRLSSTMTILLSVSALYIAVFGQIPMIGYLTSFDNYVITMYSLLIMCAFLHQFTIRLDVKVAPWPFRSFAIRMIETCGRLFVGPFACGMFIYYFKDSSVVQDNYTLFICFLTIPFSFLLIRELGGLAKAYDQAMIDIHEKMESKETDSNKYKISFFEQFLVQLYYQSTSSSHLEGIRSNRSRSMSILKGIELSSYDKNSSPREET